MLCVRCSHALPPRADRCVRCFALNPENRPAPVAISFDDERMPAPQPAAEVTEPDPAPVLTPRYAVPAPRRAPHAKPALQFEAEPAIEAGPALQFEVEPVRAPVFVPVPPKAPPRVSTRARLLAWSLDGALIGATAAACIAASLRVSHVRYPFDFLRDTAPLFGALVVLIAVAYASLLTALCGRTPGMALAGHRLRTLQGSAPTPPRALLRAILALPSAALGLFGFVLALFDRRGQTLHDKLCRCITVVD